MSEELDEFEGFYNNIIFPAYEGASTEYKRDLRNLIEGESDTLAARELKFLQTRSAHAIRNNGYAKIALKKWTTNANYIRVLWRDKKGKRHSQMQDLYDEFCENPSYDNFGDMRVLQGVSNSSLFIGGNSYIRKLIIKNSNKVPLKLQLIPYQLHDTSYNNYITSPESNEITRYGITFKDSIPKTYFFKKSALEKDLDGFSRIAVPADEIIHTFIREEPGQWLGIPYLSPILMNLYSLDDLLEATIEKQKAAQAIAILIEQTNHSIGQLPVGGVYTARDSQGNEKIYFKAKGGNVQYLNKGESAKMFQGSDIGPNFATLVEIELRRIAATLDLTYHELTNDTANLNYSSLIGLNILSRNRLEYLYNSLFIPLREKPIANYFKEVASLYYPKVSNAHAVYQMPHWRHIDDLKDAQSDVLELQNGLALYESKLAERGISIDDIIADRETIKELEKYGLSFTNDISNENNMNQANNIEANENSTGI